MKERSRIKEVLRGREACAFLKPYFDQELRLYEQQEANKKAYEDLKEHQKDAQR